MNRIEIFMALSSREKALFLEAYLSLGWFRLAIMLLPLKELTKKMSKSNEKSPLPLLDRQKETEAAVIGKTIETVARHTPWKSACLVRALSASGMLHRCGIRGRLYIGAMKPDQNGGGIEAHAWTRCGNVFVTGAEEEEEFSAVAVFEWRGA